MSGNGTFEAKPNIFLLFDRDLRVTDANEEAERAFPAPPGGIVGQPLGEVLSASIGAMAEVECRRVVDERFSRRFEALHEPSGRWLDVTAQAMRGGGGALLMSDVTALKQTLTILDAQKRALELAMEGPLVDVLEILVRAMEAQSGHEVLASILILDDEGALLRHGAGPSLPPAYRDAIDGAVIGPTVGSCGAAAYTGQTVVVTDIATDPRWVDYKDVALAHDLRACWSTPIVSPAGVVLGTFALYYREVRSPSERELEAASVLAQTAAIVLDRDRATRQHVVAEADLASTRDELARSEANFRNLADNISQFAWMADGEGNIFWYNRRWFDYTGTTLEQVSGWGWTRCQHPDHVDRVVQKIRRSWETGEPWEDTFPLRGRDGEYRWFLSRARPIRDEAGRIVRWFGTNTDVTEQREGEAALARAVEAAERASRSKDEFLAMLGHELRNPLAPIVAALELAQLRGEDTLRDRAAIERQVTHLVRLVDDLLDVSRITRGRIDLKQEEVELADVVGRALEMAGPFIEQRQHRLELELPRDGLTVHGDPVRLAQIVSNLLNNAAKYTDPGGRIRVIGGRDGDDVVLRVRDSGIGLGPEILPRVFDLFSQEEQGLDRAQGGLGLGLAIVRSLVRLHGGTIEARSEGRGAGSEFVVRLPWCLARAAAPAPAVRGFPRAPATVRALVVDDNNDAAELLAEVLCAMGHHAEVAHDGPSALRGASALRPDLALLDIGLPGMDGYELARRMRELPELSSVRLVAVTGYGQDSDRKRTIEAGFDAHLVKPVSVDSLVRAIETLCPRPPPA